MEGDVIVLQDIFRFQQTGLLRRKVQGQLVPTSIRPKFETKLAHNGVNLPEATLGNGATASNRSKFEPRRGGE